MSLKSLTKQLVSAIIGDIQSTSAEFAALATDEDRIRFTRELLRTELYNLTFERYGKCPEKSRESRETGNAHFRKNDFWKAVNSYSESIARAPNDSRELFLAYGNRSATLLRLDLFREALLDVETVLKMNIDDNFRRKMMARKENCLSSLDYSRLIYSNYDDFELKERNPLIPCATPTVELSVDDVFGRALVVRDHVKTGEVLLAEKPFSSIIVSNHFYSHCSRCYRRSFNLMPCPGCGTAMYCSEECFAESRNGHKIECMIQEILTSLEATTLELLSVKILIDASQQGEKLDELFMEVSEYDNNNNKHTFYDSNDHMNIYKLVGHPDKRSNPDLFTKSLVSCIFLTILEKYANFFHLYSGEKKEQLAVFAGGLILRYLQSMPCNGHEISDYCDMDYEEVGGGAYATLSLINHSCDPNVVRHCYKDTIVVRAIRPIKKGEQIFDNYGYHYAVQDINERQTTLAKQYYFECKCEACCKMWPLGRDLPDCDPVLINEIDVKRFELMIKNFEKNIEDIFNGDFRSDLLGELLEFLDFVDDNVAKPWKPYNVCQEAIKHCLGLQGNCFRLSKGIKKMCEKESLSTSTDDCL